MDLHTTKLEDLPGNAADVDLDEHGAWVVACPAADGLFVVSSARRFLVPRSFVHPMIRWTAGGDLLVVDVRTDPEQANGFVFDTSGTEKARFHLGDGVQDVVVAGERIVVGYFDEGVFGGAPPADEGLCVFTLDGRVEFGYRSAVRGAIDIADCYNLASIGSDRVCFTPYTEFPFVCLDLTTRRQEVHDLPESLAGSSGLVAGERGFYFHSPFSAQESIFRWRPNGVPVEVGTFPGPRLRAHGRAAFLATGVDGFTVVELEDD